MSKIIAVDVDLTVVDTLTPWLKWFENNTGFAVQNENRQYDLIPEMNEILGRKGCYNPNLQPMSFWNKPDLYDSLEPYVGSVEALESCKADGNIIVFVSYCMPGHIESKIKFLKRFFPFFDGFISTHDKHFVAYDVLIDDKLQHIQLGEQHRPESKHLLYTGIRADGKPEESDKYNQLNCWDNLQAKLGF